MNFHHRNTCRPLPCRTASTSSLYKGPNDNTSLVYVCMHTVWLFFVWLWFSITLFYSFKCSDVNKLFHHSFTDISISLRSCCDNIHTVGGKISRDGTLSIFSIPAARTWDSTKRWKKSSCALTSFLGLFLIFFLFIRLCSWNMVPISEADVHLYNLFHTI